jgi:hypothetical protein
MMMNVHDDMMMDMHQFMMMDVYDDMMMDMHHYRQ